jgi:hypothetical protein
VTGRFADVRAVLKQTTADGCTRLAPQTAQLAQSGPGHRSTMRCAAIATDDQDAARSSALILIGRCASISGGSLSHPSRC